MPIIHFLNVKQGDRSIIEHYSGNTTVVDVCNARKPEPLKEALNAAKSMAEKRIQGNFNQKKYPVNPVNEHRSFVTNIDLLIAPHHGRDSERSYDFLDVLKPKMTFFGNANSEHLAYDK